MPNPAGNAKEAFVRASQADYFTTGIDMPWELEMIPNP